MPFGGDGDGRMPDLTFRWLPFLTHSFTSSKSRLSAPFFQAGLDLFLNEDEWQREWDNILKLASSQPRTSGSSTPAGDTVDTVDGTSSSAAAGLAEGTSSCGSSKTYESLEEIHVLALAHVLKRPIFVIADTVLKV